MTDNNLDKNIKKIIALRKKNIAIYQSEKDATILTVFNLVALGIPTNIHSHKIANELGIKTRATHRYLYAKITEKLKETNHPMAAELEKLDRWESSYWSREDVKLLDEFPTDDVLDTLRNLQAIGRTLPPPQ